MSAALRRPGPSNGITEDVSFHPLQDNGKDQVHLQPGTLAQEAPDAMIRKCYRRVDDTRDAEPISPSVASSSPIVNGSHSEYSARPNGQRQPSSISMKSDTNSSESKDSQDNWMPEMDGYHTTGKKEAQRKKKLPTPLDLRETMANGLGLLLSPASTNGKLSQIPEEISKRRSSQVDSPAMQGPEKEKILKLSPAQIQELTSSPKSLPLHTTTADSVNSPMISMAESPGMRNRWSKRSLPDMNGKYGGPQRSHSRERSGSAVVPPSTFKLATSQATPQLLPPAKVTSSSSVSPTPGLSSRTVSTPPTMRRKHSVTKQNGTAAGPTPQSRSSRITPAPLQLDDSKSTLKASVMADPVPSPMPLSIPMPPLSIPTYLQLELSSDRPSPLYIHRSVTSDFPYESSRVKIERLQNFLLLPPQLEQVLWFGALACLDAWLYSFTILPLRFLKALYILSQSWGRNLAMELRFVIGIIFAGTGRMWQRRKGKDSLALSEAPTAPTEESRSRRPSMSSSAFQPPRTSFPRGAENVSASHSHPEPERKHRRMSALKHRRTKSTPSALMPDHKADILKGLLVLFSCSILMYFDASRMYHSIRGQAAIKLYVIYNVLEVNLLVFLVNC